MIVSRYFASDETLTAVTITTLTINTDEPRWVTATVRPWPGIARWEDPSLDTIAGYVDEFLLDFPFTRTDEGERMPEPTLHYRFRVTPRASAA